MTSPTRHNPCSRRLSAQLVGKARSDQDQAYVSALSVGNVRPEPSRLLHGIASPRQPVQQHITHKARCTKRRNVGVPAVS
jgi:hypothetical protein